MATLTKTKLEQLVKEIVNVVINLDDCYSKYSGLIINILNNKPKAYRIPFQDEGTELAKTKTTVLYNKLENLRRVINNEKLTLDDIDLLKILIGEILPIKEAIQLMVFIGENNYPLFIVLCTNRSIYARIVLWRDPDNKSGLLNCLEQQINSIGESKVNKILSKLIGDIKEE